MTTYLLIQKTEMVWKDETKQLLTIDHDGLGAAK